MQKVVYRACFYRTHALPFFSLSSPVFAKCALDFVIHTGTYSFVYIFSYAGDSLPGSRHAAELGRLYAGAHYVEGGKHTQLFADEITPEWMLFGDDTWPRVWMGLLGRLSRFF